MNPYMDFDPSFIRERNHHIREEVNSLRLEERLREDRGPSGSRIVVFTRRSVLPLLRAAHLVG